LGRLLRVAEVGPVERVFVNDDRLLAALDAFYIAGRRLADQLADLDFVIRVAIAIGPC
jgi:hypothetical protein